MFIDRAAEALDDGVDEREKPLEQSVDLFGIEPRGKTGVADEIAKQNRDRTAVALRAFGDGRLDRLDSTIRQGPAAAATKPVRIVVEISAASTRQGQGRAAGSAELAPFAILECAVAAAQDVALRPSRPRVVSNLRRLRSSFDHKGNQRGRAFTPDGRLSV